MLTTTERQIKQLADAWLETAIKYKVDWERELDRCERLGITHLPEPLPHPYHVEIDMTTGQAWVAGPVIRVEKAELDRLLAKREEWQTQLEELRIDLESEEEKGIREIIRDEIAHTERVHKSIEKVFDRIGF